MGYTTEFKGELKFKNELTASQINALNGIFGEDCRDHPEWNATNLSYMDFELTGDFSGMRWDGSEKSYDMVEKVNLVVKLMQEKWPDFGLTGKMLAQGESVGDVWLLKINENGVAVQEGVLREGIRTVTCPHCEEQFELED